MLDPVKEDRIEVHQPQSPNSKRVWSEWVFKIILESRAKEVVHWPFACLGSNPRRRWGRSVKRRKRKSKRRGRRGRRSYLGRRKSTGAEPWETTVPPFEVLKGSNKGSEFALESKVHGGVSEREKGRAVLDRAPPLCSVTCPRSHSRRGTQTSGKEPVSWLGAWGWGEKSGRGRLFRGQEWG